MQEEITFDEGKGLSTKAQQYDPTSVINEVRQTVDAWRSLPNPNQWQVTPENRKIKRLFSLSVTIWLAQKAVKRAVFRCGWHGWAAQVITSAGRQHPQPHWFLISSKNERIQKS